MCLYITQECLQAAQHSPPGGHSEDGTEEDQVVGSSGDVDMASENKDTFVLEVQQYYFILVKMVRTLTKT